MPVNYLHLKPQIQSLAETAAAHKADLIRKLQDCNALLQQYSDRLPEVQRAIEESAAQNKGLRCAKPVDEPLTTHHPVSLPAPACSILAADGSQITPDPHGEALYGLVNVGVFRMRTGSGLAPSITTESELLFDARLQTPGGLASESLIALMRDVKERKILAAMAQNEISPVVTLTDGQLELFHEPNQDQTFQPFFKQYLSALDDLAINQVITAGYVDRPRADLVVKMLELMVPQARSNERPFAGITDRSLFENLLKPGDRSAVFKLQSSSAEAYTNKKALHFFYLNVGSQATPALARVEVPLWVSEDQNSLSILQAVLVEGSSHVGQAPYPYPLIRAHEIAVVTREDQDKLTALIEAELLKNGFPPGFNSNKQTNKQNFGRRRM